jgi:hypothetical protein
MGRGGMRDNAGRPGWHVKAEHCRRIDARRWQREGILAGVVVGTWAWTDADTGKQLAAIGYCSERDAVVLNYSLNDKPVQQRLPILRTPCHFGGLRPWFGCPGCARRVAVLFLRSKGFLCRHCNGVAYASQSDDVLSRAWRRQRKFESRLANNDERVKGMHLATHIKLMASIIDCAERRNAALAATVARLFPGLVL